MVRKQGRCDCCGHTHEFEVSGLVRHVGTAVAAGAAIGLRKPGLLLVAVAALLFGDAIEEWFKANCPHCGLGFRLIATIATA